MALYTPVLAHYLFATLFGLPSLVGGLAYLFISLYGHRIARQLDPLE